MVDLMRGNPQAILQNPQIKEIENYVKNNGGDAKALFYKEAEAQGINPDDILSLLR